MKKLTILLFFILFYTNISCENPSDCIASSGNTISKEVEVSNFNKIWVYKGIELEIKQGDTYACKIETGENLINNIEIIQEGQHLTLKNNATCNWVREYGNAKVYITTPTLEEIHSYTEKKISSNGVLSFPVLRLVSLDTGGEVGTNDYYLQINNNQFFIETNSFVRYFISGKTNEANINLYEGDSRIDAQNLIAKKINIYHRGSNDVLAYPTEQVAGKLVNVGNLILKNTPPVVNVQELFQGRVIYN